MSILQLEKQKKKWFESNFWNKTHQKRIQSSFCFHFRNKKKLLFDVLKSWFFFCWLPLVIIVSNQKWKVIVISHSSFFASKINIKSGNKWQLYQLKWDVCVCLCVCACKSLSLISVFFSSQLWSQFRNKFLFRFYLFWCDIFIHLFCSNGKVGRIRIWNKKPALWWHWYYLFTISYHFFFVWLKKTKNFPGQFSSSSKWFFFGREIFLSLPQLKMALFCFSLVFVQMSWGKNQYQATK